MKKILVAGTALMLAGGIYASAASAEAVTPGVVITGDARVRMYYKNDSYKDSWGNASNSPDLKGTTDMDSRVRVNIKGTAAGGAYAFARLRIMEGQQGDMDTDIGQINQLNQNNLWADYAFMGIPLTDKVTVELGKYRSTYGPLPLTYNLFYDDVSTTGARGIIKVGGFEINPFIDWMDESQNVYNTSGTGTVYAQTIDQNAGNNEMRYGVHTKYKINPDWVVGGMIGYQSDDRNERPVPANGSFPDGLTKNTGGFGSIYTKGKSGQFGLVGELAVTAADLNGFNSWREDTNSNYYIVNSPNSALTTTGALDQIGSNDTGYGGYIQPSFTMDKLTLSLNLGGTQNGFLPDRAFGFVMIGATDNSVISATQIGVTGDWLWAGLIADYQVNEQLKLTGNLVYADINAWTSPGDGPGFTYANSISNTQIALDSAWELSGVLQYTISKGMDVFLSAGYLAPSLEYVHRTATSPTLQENSALGAAARFELKF